MSIKPNLARDQVALTSVRARVTRSFLPSLIALFIATSCSGDGDNASDVDLNTSENQANSNGAESDDFAEVGDGSESDAGAPANVVTNAEAPSNAEMFGSAGANSTASSNLTNNPAPVANALVNQLPGEPQQANNAVSAGTNPATTLTAPPAINTLPSPPIAAQAVSKTASSKLKWVGYDYLEKDGIIRIEMVTEGQPKFQIFQERNRADQPELVVRFFNTVMRRKIRRDIDAREFRSPVAFVRLRPKAVDSSVDVIMTLRDVVRPHIFTKSGNVMLTFAIPDRYFGNNSVGDSPVTKAELLATANVLPLLAKGSDLPTNGSTPKPFINDPGAAVFKNTPMDAGTELSPVLAAPTDVQEILPQAAPASVKTQSTSVGADNVPPTTASPLTSPSAQGGSPTATQLIPAPLVQPQMIPQPPMGGMMMPTQQPTAIFLPAPTGPATAPTAIPTAIPTSTPAINTNGSKGPDEENPENFDNGKGESSETIDKFDVREKTSTTEDFVVTGSFTIAGVAQDDDFEGVQDAGNTATSNNVTGNNAASSNSAQNPNATTNANNIGNANAPTNNPNPAAGNGNILGNAAGPSNGNLSNGAAPAVNPAAAAPANTGGSEDLLGGNAAAASAGANAVVQPPAAAPVAAAPLMLTPPPAPKEPPIEGAPDLAGAESEGVSTGADASPGSLGGRPIRLEFRGAPLTEVIRMLSAESKVNFILPPDVGTKPIYLSLNGVPFNDALQAIIGANSLGMVSIGPNLVRIDTLERLAQDREQEEKRRKSEIKIRPTKLLVYRLSYAKAENAAKMLGEILGAAATEDKRVKVQVDARTNAVIINAPAGDLSTVKALLERIDLETPQVRIATRIVELQKNMANRFGISWGTPLNIDQGRGLGFGNLVFPNSMLSRFSIDAGGQQNLAGSSRFFFGSSNNSMALDLALSAEESRNTAEVLQSSNLIVEDNEKATIIAGRSDFFRPQVIAGAGAGAAAGNTLDEVKYNLTVQVKPHITSDGSVQMELDIQSDSPTPSTGGATAAKNNRQITTKLNRRSAETAVIGGIYNTERGKSVRGVPFLSSIPIIGALFRSSESNDSKRELMVMVTPTILTNTKSFDNAAAPASDVGFSPGANAAPADSPGLGGGGIATNLNGAGAGNANGGNFQGNGGSNANAGNGGNGGNGGGNANE